MTDDNVSTIKVHSMWLHEASVVLFWNNYESAKYHERDMHHHFLKIADALGYDVKLRSAEIINLNDEIAHEIR
jgi:hypothetical protein